MTKKRTNKSKKSKLPQGYQHIFSVDDYNPSSTRPSTPPNPNRHDASFNLNSKTAREIWDESDYPFSIDRYALLKCSLESKCSINAFIIFSKHEANKPKYKKKKVPARIKFKKIGKIWKKLPVNVKDLFYCGAEVAKEERDRRLTDISQQPETEEIVSSISPDLPQTPTSITSSSSLEEQSPGNNLFTEFGEYELPLPIFTNSASLEGQFVMPDNFFMESSEENGFFPSLNYPLTPNSLEEQSLDNSQFLPNFIDTNLFIRKCSPQPLYSLIDSNYNTDFGFNIHITNEPLSAPEIPLPNILSEY